MRGFSLTELMISVAIVTIIIASSMIVFQTMSQNTVTNISITTLSQDADRALRSMERDFKKIAFYIPRENNEPIIKKAKLDNAITSFSTTLVLKNASSLAQSTVISIGDEQLNVTNVSGNTLTVTRGFNSTTASAHSSGVDVYDQQSLDRTLSTADSDSFTICYDSDTGTTRQLLVYEFDDATDTLYRAVTDDTSGDCTETGFPPSTFTTTPWEPVLKDIDAFFFDYDRIFTDKLLTVEMTVRGTGSYTQEFHTNIKLSY
jgi:prepilin-type N-terminal cleavage/methylation domain-containing protein